MAAPGCAWLYRYIHFHPLFFTLFFTLFGTHFLRHFFIWDTFFWDSFSGTLFGTFCAKIFGTLFGFLKN